VELCNSTADKAACYFLGQQFARAARADDAVRFFTQAGVYGSAIRVCKVDCFVTDSLNGCGWLFHAGPWHRLNCKIRSRVTLPSPFFLLLSLSLLLPLVSLLHPFPLLPYPPYGFCPFPHLSKSSYGICRSIVSSPNIDQGTARAF